MTYSSKYPYFFEGSFGRFLYEKSIHLIQRERLLRLTPHRGKIQHRNLPSWRKNDVVVNFYFFRNFILTRIAGLLHKKVPRILHISYLKGTATFVGVHLASVPELQYDSVRLRHARRKSSGEKNEFGDAFAGDGII